MAIRRFEEIEGWQLGRELARAVYEATKGKPFAADYGLKDQIQRAVGSIMHNVAEGFDGGSNAEFIKFLRYAQRSCREVQSQLYLALDQSYLDEQQFGDLYELADRTHGKIGGFIIYLLNAPPRRSPTQRRISNDEPRTNNQEQTS